VWRRERNSCRLSATACWLTGSSTSCVQHVLINQSHLVLTSGIRMCNSVCVRYFVKV
jgi:hypothetical protein